MRFNPLIKAVALFDQLMDAETAIDVALRGEKALLDYDEEMGERIHGLVLKSAVSGEVLSRRARRARLNLIWRDFLKEHGDLHPDRHGDVLVERPEF